MKKEIVNLFLPNRSIGKKTLIALIIVQSAIFLLYWFTQTTKLLPTPTEILSAWSNLVSNEDLIQQIVKSTVMCFHAILIAAVISLLIAYSTVLSFFKPLGFIITKFRFLSFIGLSFIFTLLTSDGYSLKISLLVFGMTVFFVTSMMSIMNSVTKNEINHARTLGFSEWKVVWEVIILGKLDQFFDVIRQNFAMAWILVTFVEGLVRSDGGVGTMLLNQNKHLRLDAVFAIQITILLVGVLQDYILGFIKRALFPYSELSISKR